MKYVRLFRSVTEALTTDAGNILAEEYWYGGYPTFVKRFLRRTHNMLIRCRISHFASPWYLSRYLSKRK